MMIVKYAKGALCMKKWVAVLLTLVMIACLSAGYAGDGYFIEYSASPLEDTENSVDELIFRTMRVIRDRLECFGVSGYRIERIGVSGIRVEIPYEYCENDRFSGLLDLIGTRGELRFFDPQGNVFMTGSMVESAEYECLEGDHRITFTLTDEGTRVFADMTMIYMGMAVPIFMDEELLLAPVIQDPVTNGTGMINGLKSADQARQIAAWIQSGALPMALTQERVDYWAELPMTEDDQ